MAKRAQDLNDFVVRIFNGSVADACPPVDELAPVACPRVEPTTQSMEKINIIAHSMGGLDARFFISHLQPPDDPDHTWGTSGRIASLTTISTPHRGSFMADVGLKFLNGLTDIHLPGLNLDQSLLTALTSYLHATITDTALRDGLASISQDFDGEFDQETSKLEEGNGVFYQSWAGLSNVGGFRNPLDYDMCERKIDWFKTSGSCPGEFTCFFTRHVMHSELATMAPVVSFPGLRPNDGLVAVDSAKHGEFRGCIPADHADEVAAFGVPTTFPFERFYRALAFDLAAPPNNF
jgi:triacylglycerol lipase